MRREISTEEAVRVINEWGVNCDNFVACKYKQTMVNGDPTDNSIELGEYFLKCLMIVCDLGIESYRRRKQQGEGG